MDEKREAPARAATRAEATMGTTAAMADSKAFSPIDFNTATGGRQPGFIEGLLPRGAQNAISTSALLKLCGLSDKRHLQILIRRERQGGALIASKATSPGGYFVPDSKQELAAFERTCYRRAVSTLRMLKSARQALSQVEGQLSIPNGSEVQVHEPEKSEV